MSEGGREGGRELERESQVGHGIELDTVGDQFEPYLWRPCGVTWDFGPEQS